MRAIVAAGDRAAPRWELAEVDDPRPGPWDLMVAVRAAALNGSDLPALRRASSEDPGAPAFVAGREFAGEVVSVGEEVTRFRAGDPVMAMVDRGAFGDLAVVDERLALPVPDGVSWEHGAAWPMGLQTEHHALRTAARLQTGDGVLVIGATSGVGSIGVQLAAALGLDPVIGTGRSRERLDQLSEVGLGVGVGPDDDVAQTVLRVTDGRGVAGVVDHVGAPMFPDGVASLSDGGRYVSVGRPAGGATPLDLEDLARRRLEVIGVTFRSRTTEMRAEIVASVEREVFPLIRSGALGTPIVHATFAFADAEAARFEFARGGHVGKFVLRL